MSDAASQSPDPPRARPQLFETLSIGGITIITLAIVSTIATAVWPIPERSGLEFWTFARNHQVLYEEIASSDTNADGAATPEIDFQVIDYAALQRRMLSGFWSGTPLPDLVEIERNAFPQYMAGPIDEVGFIDLKPLLEAEGLLDGINGPSFSPWSRDGRIFGLPHDIHPVLLCYREDLVDLVGIDMPSIETWDDFTREMKKLVVDLDGDGTPDRYPINLWYTQMGQIEALMLQAGGGTFDTDGQPLIASPANARVLAQSVAWMVGPDRIAIDAPNFDANGYQLKLDGRVVCEIMPDWLAGVYKLDLPRLSGKLRLMPLPAWDPGGKRTTVMGGTMLGIPKATDDFDNAWIAAKQLYLSEDLAERLFVTNHIISPVRRFWGLPFYHQPDPFFSGQRSGTAFLDQARDVPIRTSHPFHQMALNRIGDALTSLYKEAADGEIVPIDQINADTLRPRAEQLLAEAQALVEAEMARNVFVGTQAGERGGDE
ncbi:MAG: extracellular solute-binding protein [Planctomycetota bacterium]